MFRQDLQMKNRTQSEVSDNGATSFIRQPCLVVGTGGIGHRIVLDLKALLVAIFGSVPAGIRLLVLDIDDENLSVRVGNRLVALEREVELFCLGPVPVARIKRNLDNLPTIRDRLPSLRDLPPIAAARAAKQLRPIGQLAFQWRFPRIHDLIQDVIWTLAGRDQRGDEDLAVDPSRGLKIIQVGSNCGGTNAGLFIDLGYLLRNELEGLGTLGDACTIIGIGMLPGAFRGIVGPNLVPNTVASLMELESVMMDGNLPSTSSGHRSLTYRDGTVVDPARPPFDMYLLVDAVDEGGRVWISRDDLCRMVARAILVLAATSLGEQQEGGLDNLDGVLSQRTPDGHGTFFGSLGLATLEFPAETIVELFTARHAHAVIAEGLLRPADPQDAEADALAWLQGQGLSADALLAELARDEAGLPMAVMLEPPASLRRLPDHQVPQEAIQFVQAYSRLRLDGDYRACARHNAEVLADGAVLKLEEQVRAVVNDPRLGLAHGQTLLKALGQSLSEFQAALATRRDAIKVEEGQQEQEVNDAIQELIQAPEAIWPFRHRRVTAALDRYLQANQAFLVARLDGLVREQAVAVVATLIEHGRELERRLAILEMRLQAAAAHLAQEAQGHAKSLGRREGNPALILVDDPYLGRLYRAHAPDLGVSLEAVLASTGEESLMGWSPLEAEALAKAVRQASQGPFEAIRTMTIEDVVAARAEFSPQARLAALLDAAKPAWNLDETRLPGGDASLRRITVLGVTDHTDSIFMSNGNQLVSIHDPHTVVALSLTVGAPYTALQAWPDYLAEYERVRRLRPLHTLPAFQMEGQETGLALALGLIFGQIYTHGVHFYYRPADELEPAVRLAQGAANAIQSLSAQEGLVHGVIDRVEAHIEHIGIGQALEELTAYCTPASGDDDLTLELKRLVRDYAEMLRANARVAGRRA